MEVLTTDAHYGIRKVLIRIGFLNQFWSVTIWYKSCGAGNERGVEILNSVNSIQDTPTTKKMENGTFTDNRFGNPYLHQLPVDFQDVQGVQDSGNVSSNNSTVVFPQDWKSLFYILARLAPFAIAVDRFITPIWVVIGFIGNLVST